MPLFAAPIAAYERITSTRSTNFPLPVAQAEVEILNADNARKGHMTKNTGTTKVIILYGIKNADATTEVYRVALNPGDSYLYDAAEIIPYGAISQAAGGTIQVIELL